MADVIHRTTLEFRASVNTPDFPEPTWKHSPDMAAVAGVPARYWKAPADWNAVGAGPVEMSQAEKDAVDAATSVAAENAEMAKLDVKEVLQAFALAVLDEINQHAAKITAILDAIDNANNLGDVKTAVGAIADQPQRTIAQLKSAVRTQYQGLNGG